MARIDRAEMLELLDEGLTRTDVARWFDVTRQAVTEALKPGVKAFRATSPHIAGAPVNRSTYNNLGCRCSGCRAANAAR